ncbi:chalcone isomerase family protein [Piscinibacter gummiphilus]|uniref:Chalcone isomerase family protein n=1 Tax=Piscinibacter gummiphilus TaxID=946333 RepID=A0ABZ0D1K8_9BURK|nr:chalcone isomerase family protein [Piscinibacter gummiphilus]WOB11086.1 chalcone isomerase family protein [Piscinibacter gummiphilus]
MIIAAVLSLTAAASALADTTQVAGVKYDNGLQVGNTPLVLNGAGVRYKAVFKVYTAGLYLTRKANSPEAVLSAPGPKRMHIVMLREINASELGKLFTRGMEDNAPKDEFSKSVAGTLKMSEIFFRIKKLNAGDSFSVDWVPGVGTTIIVNGKPAADPIKEPEFFSALVKIWLGQSPADSNLKDALLGKPAALPPNS